MQDDDNLDPLPGTTADGEVGLDQALPDLYSELRFLAHQRLRRFPPDRSLNTTGLVHEAYLRLAQSVRTTFQDHDHFLAVSSRVMRNVLVDHARAHAAAKRGGGVVLEELHEETWVADVDLDRVTELNEALIRLEQLDERQARMVEQRYFGGLTLAEIAGAARLSVATVKRDLRSARAWLAVELRRE
jgi:RNA polymerase sigma factor (TIGR02999 family)